VSTNGNTAVVDPFVGRSAEEHPWVSALPLPSREERRRGLLAPVTTPVGRKQRPKLAYAAVAVAALVLVVIAQLALSIAVSNGAYKINSLQQQQRQVGRAYQAASEAASRLSSPQNLAVNASALGMVANGTPVYLRLSNGKVIGSPQPAAGTTASAQALAKASTSKAGTLQPSVPNSLLTGVPLVTSKGVTPSQVVTGQARVAASQETGSKPVAGTPAANVDPQQNGPVAWSGPLPAPSTH